METAGLPIRGAEKEKHAVNHEIYKPQNVNTGENTVFQPGLQHG